MSCTSFTIHRPACRVESDVGIMPAEPDRPALRRNAIHRRTGHLVSRPKTFDAETYDEAAQIYNDYIGWGKYHPMKD